MDILGVGNFIKFQVRKLLGMDKNRCQPELRSESGDFNRRQTVNRGTVGLLNYFLCQLFENDILVAPAIPNILSGRVGAV